MAPRRSSVTVERRGRRAGERKVSAWCAGLQTTPTSAHLTLRRRRYGRCVSGVTHWHVTHGRGASTSLGVAVVRLSGEHELATVEALRTALQRAITSRPARVLVYMAPASFVCSVTVTELLRAAATARAAGVPLVVPSPGLASTRCLGLIAGLPPELRTVVTGIPASAPASGTRGPADGRS